MTTGTTAIDLSSLEPRDAYRLIISLVVPRPIGWVATVAPDGTANLAPFSFFNLVGGIPPVVVVSPSSRRGHDDKDTLANARAVGELVVHIVDEACAEAMNATSAEVAPEVDEAALAGLETCPSTLVRPPRLASAAVALEARVSQLVPIDGTSYTMILARVVMVHLRTDLLRVDGTVDPARLRPIARLGGDDYTTLGRVFTMARPRVPPPHAPRGRPAE